MAAEDAKQVGRCRPDEKTTRDGGPYFRVREV